MDVQCLAYWRWEHRCHWTHSDGNMHNASPVMAAHKDAGPFGIYVVLLRVAQIVFSLIGFAVMAANKATIYHTYYVCYYGNQYYTSTLKFSAIKSFVCVNPHLLLSFYSHNSLRAHISVYMFRSISVLQGSGQRGHPRLFLRRSAAGDLNCSKGNKGVIRFVRHHGRLHAHLHLRHG